MAEIGLIASVIQVAGAGLKLSQTLYQYADTVSSADRRVKDIAKDVRLTSIVIQELGHVFKTDESAALLSKSALQTADETVRECEAVFSDLDATLKKSTKSSFGKWKYPFRESKIELLRAHIEKLKSTLQLLMQVLTHAHQVASQKLDREAEAAQREQIKALLQHKKDSAERYEASLKNYKLNADDISDEEDSTDALVGAFSATSFPSINTIATSGASMKSTMTVQTLATCVRHVRSLLEDIEALQQELKNDAGSIDPSDHHQTLVGAYFRARKHLDSLLLGNPEKSVESSTDSGTQSLHKTLTGSTLQAGTSQESVIAKPPSRPRPRARLGEAGARDEIMALEHRKERQEAEVRIAEIHVERKLASTSEALTIAAEQWQQSERYATKARSTRLEVTSMAPGAQSTQSKYGAVLSKYDKEAQLQTEKAKVMEERAVEEEKKLLDARKRLQEAKGELAKITLEYERVAARLNPGQRENDRNVLSRDLLWEREAERRKIVLETQRKSSGQSARSAEAERAAAELALESLRAEEDDAIRRMETGVKKEWGRAEKQTSRGAKWDEAHRQRADEELRMKREYELTTTMEERRKHELRRMKAEAEMERNRADEWASESRKTLGQNQLRRMKAEVERMKRTEVEELELDREEKKHYPYAEGHHETGTHFDEPRRFSRPRGGDANEIEIVEAELSQSPPRPPAFIPSKRARHYRRDAIARQLWGIEVELDFCRKMLEYGQQKSISNQAVFLAMKQREVELTERSSLLSELRERKIREAKLKKDQKQGPSSSTPWSAEKDRKMTTPGCLTCRMRRITCGQEEPHCKNCTSTGRKCEGYGHRVVFAWEKSAPIPSVYNTPLSNSHPPRLAPSYFSPAQRSHLILDAEIVPRYSNTLPSYRRDREDRRLLPPPSSRSYKDHSESPFLRASPYSPAPKEPHCADLRPRSRESARDQERRTRREDRHEDRARAARSSERTLEYDTRIHRREQRKPLSDFLLEAQLETDSDDDASLNRPRTTIPRSGGEKSYDLQKLDTRSRMNIN
ncbi:hypothetical protein M011DRAFT_269391 [Sporormia fimetaria CBS 119925]|uniref:Zn(2)-C6 fungal-type domain-containing protein n=1 Tax=Sporormia fimetaria CBS 119925 TaxID=1340428 RepID=A0A6A6UXB7_9PLEO|nr:hypothetical protein M011DRAFT_269391 [Sporormia fimetaria CBS 119925]